MNKKIPFIFFVLVFLISTTEGQIRFGQKKAVDEEINISYTNPQEFEIEAINVEGTEFLDKNALVSLSGLSIGDKIKIPSDDITSAIKRLWKQGIIGDITIYAKKSTSGKVILTIKLTERPRLSTFVFKGLNRTQESDIEDEIDLIRGRIVTDAMLKNTELIIRKYFIEKGYLNAQVNIRQKKDTLLSNHVKILIDVNKKSKVKINRITFEGNTEISDGKLKKKLKSTHEHPRISVFKDVVARISHFKPMTVPKTASNLTLSGMKAYVNQHFKLNFFKSSKYIPKDFHADKDLLINYYNSKGFRDAEIVSDTVYAHNGKTVNIEMKLDEGEKYYFRDIIWTGNYIHTDQTLSSILGVEKGDVYDMEMISRRLNFNPTGPDISSLYMDNGYLFFRIEPVEVKIENDSIDVEMRIYEGAQATINKIIVNGNDQTHDHVIYRELLTQPGDKFSRSNIIKTNQRLSALGYFDPENIDIRPIPNPVDGTVDIEYNLTEQSNDQIELSGGWGGSFGFVGTLGLVLNNFSLRNIPHLDKWNPLPRGDGQRMAIRFQANGRRFQSYSVTFTEPWLGGKKPNAFTVNFSHSVQRSLIPLIDDNGNVIVDSNGAPVYDYFRQNGELVLDDDGNPIPRPVSINDFNGHIKLTGGSISLGKRVRWPDDFFQLSNSISYLHYDLLNQNSTSLGFATGSANSITFTTTLARNSIDNPTFPKSGSNLSLSVSLTPPYSLWRDLDYDNISNEERYKWIEYHKWMFDAGFYTKLAGNLVLATKAHLGFIGGYSDELGIGPFERFIVGGAGLAGQNFLLGTDLIGLRGYDDNSIVPRDPITGIRGGTVYNKFLMELRYPISLNPSSTIYVLGFAEAGNNFSSFQEYNPFNNFKTVGFGARIFMPAFGLIGIDWGIALDDSINGITPNQQVFQFRIGQQLR